MISADPWRRLAPARIPSVIDRRQDPDEPAEGVEVDRIAGKDPAGNPMLGEDDIEVFGAGVGDRSEIDRD